MENFRVFCTLLANLHHDVRLCRLGDLNCVVLFVVEVDPVFIMGFAHLALERSPFYTYYVLCLGHLKLFPQPRPQTSQVNVPH